MFTNWFPESISHVAREIDKLFWFATGWTVATGLLVVFLLVYFLIRYRSRPQNTPLYTHGNSRQALLLTLVLSVFVFVALDLNLAYQDHKVWKLMFGQPPSAAEALRVEVMPEQFAWNVRYAGADNQFGTADDAVTINEFHVPVNKPVLVQLTSKDVVHSFFLPNLRIKQDAVPGMVTSLYFTAESVGQFNIACAQHCGLGHYRMKGEFVVEPQADFEAWLLARAQEPADVAPWGWDWLQGLASGGPAKKEMPS